MLDIQKGFTDHFSFLFWIINILKGRKEFIASILNMEIDDPQLFKRTLYLRYFALSHQAGINEKPLYTIPPKNFVKKDKCHRRIHTSRYKHEDAFISGIFTNLLANPEMKTLDRPWSGVTKSNKIFEDLHSIFD